MVELNFPSCSFRVKKTGTGLHIFDGIRKKFVALTPEEWVRQHTVEFICATKGYPRSWVSLERKISLNGLTRRYDIAVFGPDGRIALLVECKAPDVAVSQQTFDQIARYNMALGAAMLMVTNGLQHHFCTIDHQNARYDFLPDLPMHQNTPLSR
jgi:hypothetical protein